MTGSLPQPAADSAAASTALTIVGVGASAGGLEALQRMFERAPADGGLAYVVVQHLSPDFKSLMEELLGRHTRLQIRTVSDGVQVEPNVVYLIPPSTDMIIAGGRLHLKDRDPDQLRTLPIDVFFRSLAQEAGARAVAVVLSGTGSDGSRGVRAVHEAGGLVVVQDERTAKFDGMPRSAIDTGVVDFVLPPEEITAVLVRHARNDPGRPTSAVALQADVADGLEPVFQRLRQVYGIDFSLYKPSTIGRRIQRRMELCEVRDLEQYAERLLARSEELDTLYRDLLIGVTRFFRDPDAWARVREALDQLVARLEPDDELRAWVAGCATGEEAYTVAMLALEALREAGRPPRLKLFATDAHRSSLEHASAGVYDAEALAAVPPALRERYFQPQNGHLVARQELRTHVVFAAHDVLRDAPFTRLDLITCRNLLIYFLPQAQRRVISLFHFALKTGGVLVLGPSETPGELADEFHVLDEHWKAFRKRREVRLAEELRLSTSEETGRRRIQGVSPHEQLLRDAREALVQELAPATFVVDARGALVETLNNAAEYLTPRDGTTTSQLLELVHRDLKLAIAHGLRRAVERGELASLGNVRVRAPDSEQTVTVTVRPLRRSADKVEGCAVMIRPDEPPRVPPLVLDERALDDEARRLVASRLEAVELELQRTKENLQATIEELETSNEELQATNEELIASNEELQSTNEELHSVNEELYTVNAEHQAKIAQLTELTADMENLLASTDVHTLFLDRELRLRKFTPRIAESFNLLPQDVGRRLDTFSHTLDHAGLLDDVRAVLERGEAVEREVRDKRGRELLMRLLPYRVRERLEGAVITFIDVSLLKEAQRALQEAMERYRTLVHAVASVVWTADPQLRFVQPQPEWERATGQRGRAHLGHGWLDAVHAQDQAAVRRAIDVGVERREVVEARCRVWSEPHGAHRWFALRAAPVLLPDGAIREWIGTLGDVHSETLLEQEHRRVERQLQGILAHSPAFLYVKDLQGRYLLANPQCRAYLGAEVDEVIGKTDLDLLPPEVADRIRSADRQVALRGAVEEIEEQLPARDGQRTYLSVKFPLPDDEGQVIGVAGISTDISERKRASERDREAVRLRDRFLAMLSHELRNPLGAVLTATYALARPELSPAARARAPETIRRQVEHMGRLLDDLLDVARLTRDRLEVRRELVDFAAIVHESVELMRGRFETAGVGLEGAVADGPAWITGDAMRLQQVVMNLLSNALKYTPAGGRATVRLARQERLVVLKVVDTGIGIDPAHLGRIFDLFYQEENTLDRARGGLGVGLTLVREIVDLHEGTIRAASDGSGQGSELTVELPMAPADAVGAEEAAAGDGRLRVVVVEDLADSRELVAMILRDSGHVVEIAGDGEAGLARIEALRPHVAFVDIGLPLLDGYEVARRVRASAQGRFVYLVALTGYGRAEDRQRAFDAGFDEHLVKPLALDTVFTMIERAQARFARRT